MNCVHIGIEFWNRGRRCTIPRISVLLPYRKSSQLQYLLILYLIINNAFYSSLFFVVYTITCRWQLYKKEYKGNSRNDSSGYPPVSSSIADYIIYILRESGDVLIIKILVLLVYISKSRARHSKHFFFFLHLPRKNFIKKIFTRE